MNYKSIAKGLLLSIVVALLSSFITYQATIKSALATNKQSLDGLTPTILAAIKKETTAIKNDINVDIAKIKKSDSLILNIKQIPDNKLTQKFKEINCVPEGYTILKTENLTRKQRRRLGILK